MTARSKGRYLRPIIDAKFDELGMLFKGYFALESIDSDQKVTVYLRPRQAQAMIIGQDIKLKLDVQPATPVDYIYRDTSDEPVPGAPDELSFIHGVDKDSGDEYFSFHEEILARFNLDDELDI